MDLIDAIKNLSVSHRRSLKDDDFLIDRLHHRYTVAALVLFCAIVTTSQYAGEPINCWVPAQFTGSFEMYTNRLCWLQNTYYVEEDVDIPDDMNERREAMLKYYQWIHLIILLQSVLFLIPRVIWRSLNDKCGIEIYNYVEAAMKYETVEKYAEREKLMSFLSGHITTFIHAKESYYSKKDRVGYKIKRIISFILFWTGKRFGNYLIILYSFVKLIYLFNVFGQLFLMTQLLGIRNYHFLGFEILQRMAKGKDMIANHYFPKVTHCDFKIRELGNDHQYTVQCVLSINIFTEKIYVILWFWFVILTILTLVDFFLFIFKNGLSSQRNKYVKKHVQIFSKINKEEHGEILKKFSNKFLKPDVVLVFKIIATNVNGIIVSELIKELWETYYKKHRPQITFQEQTPNTYDNEENDDDDEENDEDYSENLSIVDKNSVSMPKFPSPIKNPRKDAKKLDNTLIKADQNTTLDKPGAMV